MQRRIVLSGRRMMLNRRFGMPRRIWNAHKKKLVEIETARGRLGLLLAGDSGSRVV